MSLDLPSLVSCALGPDGLSPRALGEMVRLLHVWALGGSRRRTLALLDAAGWDDALLADADFSAGLGSLRFKSRTLLRRAFRGGAGGAVLAVERLMAAGMLNPFSAAALRALHRGMRGWRALGARVALLTAICSELDSFGRVGLFLSLFLDCPDSELQPREAAALLEGVLRCDDVRDLAGTIGDLEAYLPDYADAVAAALRGASDGEDDADAEGNLAGFVQGDDDDLVYDTGVEGESSGASEVRSEASGSDARSEASGSDAAAAVGRGGRQDRPRKRLRKSDPGDGGRTGARARTDASAGAPRARAAPRSAGPQASRYMDTEAGRGVGSDSER